MEPELSEESSQDNIRKYLRRLAVATIVVYFALFGLGLFGFLRVQHVVSSTHQSLCSFEHDLQQRIISGEQFLKDHPDGIPGVPVAVIQTSLDNQKLTLQSLSGLNCEEK